MRLSSLAQLERFTSSETFSRSGSRSQHKCACRGNTLGGECEECRKNQFLTEWTSRNSELPIPNSSPVPPIVHQVLRSSGEPLDPATMTLMQRRFGHDFSRVRVHTDGTAAESARAVNSVAYTVGSDVVFGAGSYSPRSSAGRSLLAHELTHVVQQNFGAQRIASPFSLNRPNDPAEREAAQMGRSSFQGREPQPSISTGSVQVQRLPADQEDDFHEKLTEEFRSSHGLPARGQDEPGQPLSPSDAETKYRLGPLAFAKEQAAAIISRAKNSTVSLGDRAVEAVKSIVREYYDESLVSDVTYVEKTRGLATTPVGKGSSAKGKLTVGRYFIEHIDQFARRVLQVGHELQHVQQQREGMSGEKNQDKREFLAFAWEGLATERLGTGRMPDAMRRDLIDWALGYFNCLPAEDQKAFAAKQAELLERRRTVNGTRGNPSTEPPRDCRRQPP
jgi:Domain of unknown function (DUF4157)